MKNVIYLGPALGDAGLFTNQIFVEVPEEYLDRLQAKYPQIRLLFAPVDKLPQKLNELKNPGSLISQAVADVKSGGTNITVQIDDVPAPESEWNEALLEQINRLISDAQKSFDGEDLAYVFGE